MKIKLSRARLLSLILCVLIVIAACACVWLIAGPPTAAASQPSRGKPVVDFANTACLVAESESQARITVQVSARPLKGQAIAVHYFTLPGTATEGLEGDYIPATGVLTFTKSTPTSLSFPVTIINDSLLNEPDETVNLVLMLLTPGTAIIGNQVAVLIIVDDDLATATPGPRDESVYLQPIFADIEPTKTPPAPP